jgi:NaMN:DMB phosphoribosyltransferase
MLILLNALLTLGIRQIDWRAHLGGLVAGFVAGLVAEGWGDRRTRRVVLVAGFAAMVAIGVALVAWRTADIRALPAFKQAVAFFGS